MSELSKKSCEACRADAPKVTKEEIAQYAPSIPKWDILEEAGIAKLKRAYSFSKYADTLALVNAIAAIADEENHHPDMFFEYKTLTVFWWSHKIKGLHINDFICAAKCDSISEAMN